MSLRLRHLREYASGDCGHKGWSRHSELERKEAQGKMENS